MKGERSAWDWAGQKGLSALESNVSSEQGGTHLLGRFDLADHGRRIGLDFLDQKPSSFGERTWGIEHARELKRILPKHGREGKWGNEKVLRSLPSWFLVRVWEADENETHERQEPEHRGGWEGNRCLPQSSEGKVEAKHYLAELLQCEGSSFR